MSKRFIFGIFALLILVCLSHDFTFGFRYPWSDEWDLVPMLTGTVSPSLKWLWAQHNEHRIVIPKLLYLVSFNVLPDFRLPILLILMMMILAAYRLMSNTAKNIVVNPIFVLVFPMLLLNMNLGYHYWGFHIQFASSTILLCFLLSTLVQANNAGYNLLNTGKVTVISLVLLLLPLCGMNGVLPEFILAPYFILRGVNLFKHAASVPLRRSGAVIIISGLIAMMITALVFVGYHTTPHDWGDPNFIQLVAAVMHVLSAPLSFGALGFPVGLVIFVFIVFVVVQLIRNILISQADRTLLMWGNVDLLAFVLSMSILALGLGWGRGGRGWVQGLDGHYSLLMVPLLCVLFIVCLLNKWTNMVYAFWIITVLMFCINMIPALKYPFVDKRSRKIDSYLDCGVNADSVVASHMDDFFFEDSDKSRMIVKQGLLDLKLYYIKNSFQGKILKLNE